MARNTEISNPEIVSVEKSPRRTPARIAQDELDGTLAKLDAAKARKERAEASLQSAEQAIEKLTALADYQASHPALKQAQGEVVEEPAGGIPVADA